MVRTWPKPKSVQDIQVFVGFANFYQQFIQNFSKISVLLMLMSKTSLDSIQTQRMLKLIIIDNQIKNGGIDGQIKK